MLHIAFDYGYLFEAGEIESVWEQLNNGSWAPLPEKNEDVWYILQQSLEAAIAEGSKPELLNKNRNLPKQPKPYDDF